MLAVGCGFTGSLAGMLLFRESFAVEGRPGAPGPSGPTGEPGPSGPAGPVGPAAEITPVAHHHRAGSDVDELYRRIDDLESRLDNMRRNCGAWFVTDVSFSDFSGLQVQRQPLCSAMP